MGGNLRIRRRMGAGLVTGFHLGVSPGCSRLGLEDIAV